MGKFHEIPSLPSELSCSLIVYAEQSHRIVALDCSVSGEGARRPTDALPPVSDAPSVGSR
jgi:hypothetical protein